MRVFLVIVYYIVNIITIIILLRVLVSWYIRNPRNTFYLLLCWLTNPIILPIRRTIRWFTGLLPLEIRRPLRWLGRLDFSPAVAIVLLWLIYYLLFWYLPWV